MADAIVNYVLGKIGDVAYQKALLLYGAGDAVEWAKRELEWVSAFLQDADAKQNKDAMVKQWVKDVKEVAYLIEDALDKFLVKVGGGSQMGLLERARKIPKVLHARYEVGTKIESIKKRMIAIKENTESFGITAIENSSTGPARQPIRMRPIIPELDKKEVVGFVDAINDIRDRLLDHSNLRRTVISIVAPGGCGKTTVATKVYNSAEVKSHFDDRIWLTISQKWTMNDVLIKMLEKLEFEVTAGIRQKSEDYLMIKIHESLSKKKYLIVFDDVWSIDFWGKLEEALPEDKNGSRVLITTRDFTVAAKAEIKSKPYGLRFLDEDESKKLLLKIVFPNWNVAECPGNLLPLAAQFAKKCKGLPLAVVVLGGFLSTKSPDYDTWNEIMSKMNWNTEGAECMDIVSTSYDDLPRHLKLCFMYFASFPEDYEINVSKLVQMWIAEGFIQPETPKSQEDTAMNYLEELIQRCMVQVSHIIYTSLKTVGKIKYCRIHDILHALAIRKAEEDNFLMVCTKSRDDDSNSGFQTPIPIRRVAFPEFGDGDTQPVGVLGPNLRSLMCYGTSLPNCNKLEMARVLSLRYKSSGSDNADDDDLKYWKWLKQVTSLRYLRVQNIGRLECANLSNLAQLKYLQTLEMSGVKHRARNRNASRSTNTCLCCVNNNANKNKKNKKDENNENNEEEEENEELLQLPDSFWDNKMLRHVIFAPTSKLWMEPSSSELWIGPPSSAELENLLTLKVVHARDEWSRVKLPCFPRIRKLSIVLDANFNWEAMTNSLVQQKHLISLHVSVRDPHKVTDNIINYVTPALRNYKQLHSLTLPLFQKIDFSPESDNFFEPIISVSDMLPPNLSRLRYLAYRVPAGSSGPESTASDLEKLQKNFPHLWFLTIHCDQWSFRMPIQLSLSPKEELESWFEMVEGANP